MVGRIDFGSTGSEGPGGSQLLQERRDREKPVPDRLWTYPGLVDTPPSPGKDRGNKVRALLVLVLAGEVAFCVMAYSGQLRWSTAAFSVLTGPSAIGVPPLAGLLAAGLALAGFTMAGSRAGIVLGVLGVTLWVLTGHIMTGLLVT